MNDEGTEQGPSEDERHLTRLLVDGFGAVTAAELLGLSPAQLVHISLGLPVTPDTARLCRAGLAQVNDALHEVLPLFEEPPLAPEALRDIGRGFARNIGAAVIASQACALGNSDGPRANPFMSAAFDDSDNPNPSQERK